MTYLRIIAIIFWGFSLFACSNNIEDKSSSGIDNYEKITVSLSLNQESSESGGAIALSSTGNKGVAAIQVKQKTPDSIGEYTPYAVGLWDELSNISITLNKGCYYEIELTYLPTAKDFVATDSRDGSYRQPFKMLGSEVIGVDNRFHYSTSQQFTGLSRGTTAVITGETSHKLYNRPLGYRYYVLRSGILIEKETTIDLSAKLVVFGLKYDITGLNEGQIIVRIKDAPDIILTPQTESTFESIITFQGNLSDPKAWSTDNYSEAVACDIIWIDKNGLENNLESLNFEVIRREMYTLRVDLTQSTPKGHIEVNLEEGLIDGGYIN